MARGRKRADEILAFDPVRGHPHRGPGRHGQIALAHRARLRGTEKRTRPRPFRGAKLARLPSSRNPVHRRLWFPHPRTSGDSPLWRPAARNVSPIPASQTPRRRRSDPNDTSKTRSRPSDDSSQSPLPETSCAARVAKPCDHNSPIGGHRDTVELGACLLNPGEMGFEPLKPVGELDAANSRIRFDVRVEALRPSFVAPFPRWRSSAHCECGKGRSPPLGELQDIVGEADEAPLVGDLLDAAQEKLTEAARLLDLSEHRLGQLLS